jgi:ATP-dependent DNA helicase RecG
LHFALTPEALFGPHESLPWNPLIARVFFRRGIIESWGRGTTKITELTRKAGLPRPDIEDAGGSVTVRFRPNRYVPPQRVAHDLTERQRQILAILEASHEGLALRDIRSRLDQDTAAWETKDDLALLKQLELIESRGRGRGAYWTLLRR